MCDVTAVPYTACALSPPVKQMVRGPGVQGTGSAQLARLSHLPNCPPHAVPPCCPTLRFIDRDGSGALNAEEIEDALNSLGIFVTREVGPRGGG